MRNPLPLIFVFVAQVNAVWFSLSGVGVWTNKQSSLPPCPNAPGVDVNGNDGDFANYCIFRTAVDAENYCLSQPQCLGYTLTNSQPTTDPLPVYYQLIIKAPSPNANWPNAQYFAKQIDWYLVGVDLWPSKEASFPPCPSASGVDVSGDYANYCVFRNVYDARDYCLTQPQCLGYTTTNLPDGSASIYQLASGAPSPNPNTPNAQYWSKQPPEPTMTPAPTATMTPTPTTPTATPTFVPSSVLGRYVIIAANNPSVCMNVGELEVYDMNGVNVARNALVLQSDFWDASTFPAAHLVDGDVNTFAHASCNTASAPLILPDASTPAIDLQFAWMEVDLGADILISSVVVQNRRSCCQDRLAAGVQVLIFNSQQPSSPVFLSNILTSDLTQVATATELPNEGDGSLEREPRSETNNDEVPFVLHTAGVWPTGQENFPPCKDAPGVNTKGNDGDFANYCIFDSQKDAKDYCSSQPTCLGFVTKPGDLGVGAQLVAEIPSQNKNHPTGQFWAKQIGHWIFQKDLGCSATKYGYAAKEYYLKGLSKKANFVESCRSHILKYNNNPYYAEDIQYKSAESLGCPRSVFGQWGYFNVPDDKCKPTFQTATGTCQKNSCTKVYKSRLSDSYFRLPLDKAACKALNIQMYIDEFKLFNIPDDCIKDGNDYYGVINVEDSSCCWGDEEDLGCSATDPGMRVWKYHLEGNTGGHNEWHTACQNSKLTLGCSEYQTTDVTYWKKSTKESKRGCEETIALGFPTAMYGYFNIPDEACMPTWAQTRSTTCSSSKSCIRNYQGELNNPGSVEFSKACTAAPPAIIGNYIFTAFCKDIYGEFEVFDLDCCSHRAVVILDPADMLKNEYVEWEEEQVDNYLPPIYSDQCTSHVCKRTPEDQWTRLPGDLPRGDPDLTWNAIGHELDPNPPYRVSTHIFVHFQFPPRSPRTSMFSRDFLLPWANGRAIGYEPTPDVSTFQVIGTFIDWVMDIALRLPRQTAGNRDTFRIAILNPDGTQDLLLATIDWSGADAIPTLISVYIPQQARIPHVTVTPPTPTPTPLPPPNPLSVLSLAATCLALMSMSTGSKPGHDELKLVNEDKGVDILQVNDTPSTPIPIGAISIVGTVVLITSVIIILFRHRRVKKNLDDGTHKAEMSQHV